MTENHRTDSDIKPWYKQRWPWILIAMPGLMVIISIFGLIIPAVNTDDTLVSDDYYKEGKNIYLQMARDETAFKHHISAQVYIQPDMDGVMVITKGDYDTKEPLRLLFIHPTLKKYDQTVTLTQSPTSPLQYTAKLNPKLPATNNWIVRLEDSKSQWRVESRWVVSQGNAVALTPQNMSAPSQSGGSS